MRKIDLSLPEFHPYFGIWTGHSQTILGHVVPSKKLNKEFKTEVMRLKDGDELLLEWRLGTEPYTLSLFHGLAGSAQADYIQRSALIAIDFGWNVVLVNHRGASDRTIALQSYHSGRGEDAEAVIEWARKKFPESRQIALGFSLSGSVLLNLLSGRFGKNPPDVGIVVNAPLDLKKCSTLLRTGFSKVYDLRFYFLLKKLIQKKYKMKMPLMGTTLDIDERFTSKVNGFKDSDDYYSTCSTVNHLENITIPTFVLTAEDDPFVDVVDYKNAKWPESVHLTIKKHGGHMGYISKKADPKYGRRWLDAYLRSVFDRIQKMNS